MEVKRLLALTSGRHPLDCVDAGGQGQYVHRADAGGVSRVILSCSRRPSDKIRPLCRVREKGLRLGGRLNQRTRVVPRIHSSGLMSVLE